MKRVKIRRKRNEKHKVENEEDSKKERNLNRDNFCWQGISKIRRINKKERKEFVMEKVEKTKRMRQAKRDTLWKEIETEGKWKKKNHETGFTGKKRNNYKKEKQGDTQKGKREKKDEQEKTQQKEIKQE